MLTDIKGFFIVMFYSLNTEVRGVKTKNMVEGAPKGNIDGMVHCVSEWS